MQHVYIIGSKSLGQYGGFETFVKRLIEEHQHVEDLQYHIACKANGEGCMKVEKLSGVEMLSDSEFRYCNAHCFMVPIPEKLGPAQAIYYDIAALKWCCNHIEKNAIEHPIVYILASRIGPFEGKYARKIHALGGRIFQNPDGHEDWRKKWSLPIRKYWKFSEGLMVKHADLVVCDSVAIEKYIQEEYAKYHPKTTFIAYGADITQSPLADDDPRYMTWLKEHDLRDHEFYISVGRFVPENNFEVMIREFMASSTTKDFAVITTENPKFYDELEKKYHLSQDARIKFVGAVYDQDLLKKIRENAFAYFHGHEVGGTNPSLLEALGSTRLNLLLDVSFNREVAGNSSFYWNKDEGNLASLINVVSKDLCSQKMLDPKKRIKESYSWEKIASQYKIIFGG